MPVHQVRQRTGGRHGREQAQHQKHPGGDLTARCHVGQDVGVLEAHVGQRLLKAVESWTAPQAEGLLQAVPDEQCPDRQTQKKQSEVLGAAPVASPVAGIRFDLGGLRGIRPE